MVPRPAETTRFPREAFGIFPLARTPERTTAPCVDPIDRPGLPWNAGRRDGPGYLPQAASVVVTVTVVSFFTLGMPLHIMRV